MRNGHAWPCSGHEAQSEDTIVTRALPLNSMALAATFAVTAGLANAQSITNGDFEAVQIGPPFFSSNPADIPGWTHFGTVGDALLWGVGYVDGGGSITVAGHGNQFVTLGSGCCGRPLDTSGWETTITGLTPGHSYRLTFMVANETNAAYGVNQTLSVDFASGSKTGSSSYTTPFSAANYWRTWVPESKTFVATGTDAVVQFVQTNQIYDMGLDNVAITAAGVPEPAGWAMMLAGIACLGAAKRGSRRERAPAIR